jgi:PPK2 family polyphosphate:nucleotide phosphotransferase
MKTPIVTARPGHKISLRKIDPDDTGSLKKADALERFAELRERVSELQQILFAERKRSLLLIFQAMDTGGKDSSIRDLCVGLDPAGVRVRNFKAPSEEELAHDFLWRIHKATPAKGLIGIWNRSHYEDVLIVRVHKEVPKKVWKSRYGQINAFEKILCENGTTILKFMLHISKDEQKKRLQERLENPRKWWKFNPNDVKDRALWGKYQRAYEDAINCCSTDYAPWHIVPANHKWARNLAMVELLLRTLRKMDPRYPKLSFDPKKFTIE